MIIKIIIIIIIIIFLIITNFNFNEYFYDKNYYNLELITHTEKLFTFNRLDLIVNLIYCDFYDKSLKTNFAKNLYIKWKKLEKGEKLIEHGNNQYIRINRGESVKEGEKDYINKNH